MIFFIVLIILIIVVQIQSFILFPATFVVQLTMCVAVPSGIPNRTFALNLCMQANYMAFSNITQLSPLTIQAKSNDLEPKSDYDFDRKTLYNYITNILNDYIFTGEECLKRLICETAASTIETSHKNSLLEKILLYIVTPSKDVVHNDTEMIMYHEAERIGKLRQNCILKYNDCQFSLLDFITNKFMG